MNEAFYDAIADAPIIAAVKDHEGLEACLVHDNIQVVFLLFGDILSLEESVKRIHEVGKIVIVHLDFISGLQCAKDISVDYIKNTTGADGIITTHPNCIKRAKELGMYTVLRAFVLDSIALQNVAKLASYEPDFIEILPGIMPKIIEKIHGMTDVPLLAGGLISEKEDVIAVLHAGAVGISATKRQVWDF